MFSPSKKLEQGAVEQPPIKEIRTNDENLFYYNSPNVDNYSVDNKAEVLSEVRTFFANLNEQNKTLNSRSSIAENKEIQKILETNVLQKDLPGLQTGENKETNMCSSIERITKEIVRQVVTCSTGFQKTKNAALLPTAVCDTSNLQPSFSSPVIRPINDPLSHTSNNSSNLTTVDNSKKKKQ